MDAYEAAKKHYASRAKQITFESAHAEHVCDNKVQSQIADLTDRLLEEGALIPLMQAMEESDHALSIDPDKASNSVWAHALSGMAGHYLNLTLNQSKRR